MHPYRFHVDRLTVSSFSVMVALAGDGDYGKPSGLPWAMSFAHGMVPTPPGVTVNPTPVYESLTMLVIFVILYRIARKPQPGWMAGGWFLIPAGSERFLVEFLRRDPHWLAGLTEAQWVSIFAVVLDVTIMAFIHGRPLAMMPAAARGATRVGSE